MQVILMFGNTSGNGGIGISMHGLWMTKFAVADPWLRPITNKARTLANRSFFMGFLQLKLMGRAKTGLLACPDDPSPQPSPTGRAARVARLRDPLAIIMRHDLQGGR